MQVNIFFILSKALIGGVLET